VRAGLKKMGELASADLEPPSQTRLADATMNVQGCLIAGVPGGMIPPP
jgi:phosphomevalonate kinase